MSRNFADRRQLAKDKGDQIARPKIYEAAEPPPQADCVNRYITPLANSTHYRRKSFAVVRGPLGWRVPPAASP